MTWLVAAASLTATWLNIRRVRACFGIWLVTNTAWAIYDFAHGLPAQGCLMCVYAALAVYGWVAWGRASARRAGRRATT
jgi:nicotinamide riboside transporter PnuC